MKPLVETLQRELDQLKTAIDANQAQRDALQADLVILQARRAELKDTIDFLRNRTPTP